MLRSINYSVCRSAAKEGSLSFAQSLDGIIDDPHFAAIEDRGMPKARREGPGKRPAAGSAQPDGASPARRRYARRTDDHRHRDLIAAAADWLWECSVDGRINFLSPAFEASTGLQRRSVLGTRLSDLASADLAFAAADAQRAAIAAQKPFRDLVFKLGEAAGPWAWLEIAGTPIVEAGAFRGYCGLGKTVTARIEAALALRNSERRHREFFDVASDWFWETDREGRVSYLSSNVEAVLGLPVAAYIGKRVAETEGIVIELTAGRANLAAFRARQPYRDFVYSRKLPNGRIVWVNSSGAPFYGEDGAFLGYRGIARDVTGRIKGERALRDSELEVRQLLEAAADYYWEYDTQHRYVYMSPQFEALTGIPSAAVLGKRLVELPGVSVDPEMGKMVLQAIKARQPFRDFVYSRKYPDGKVRWFKVSGAPGVDRDGNFRGYRGVGAEITAHAEAEAAARLAQRRLHDAVAHVSEPFVVYDAADCAVAFNQAFTDLHRAPDVNTPVRQGVSFRELAEWQLQTGFYDEGPDEQAVGLDTLLDHYQSDREQTYHLRDGRWMMVVYRRLPGDGRVGLWTDISALKRTEAERRRLETQLHHSQRLEALGTLVGGAAHEINNALVPVIALTKLVASHLPEESRDRRNLGTVLVGAERSRDLVKQILAFSRKEDVESRRESVDVAAVLREALRLMRATVPSSIHLEEDIAPVPPVTGDPNQLHQVIVNLVANAAHAIGDGHGTVTVGLRADGDGATLRFWVADTGCGMDEATKVRIFEPFFTTKEVGKGTGLGLSVVHGIIKEHGGRIEVQSAPGKGTRFDVVLPTETAQTVAAA
jgi:PAS domain S-box-containing protein